MQIFTLTPKTLFKCSKNCGQIKLFICYILGYTNLMQLEELFCISAKNVTSKHFYLRQLQGFWVINESVRGIIRSCFWIIWYPIYMWSFLLKCGRAHYPFSKENGQHGPLCSRLSLPCLYSAAHVSTLLHEVAPSSHAAFMSLSTFLCDTLRWR